MNVGSASSKDKIHFPGLNSLRFFAALSVFIGHAELTKKYVDLPNKFELFDRINFGGIGVYFFFVLSGFLITYLLCAEKERFRTISIKDFYVRRLLRIWPLYYLLVILGFFILPSIDYFALMKGSFSVNFNSNLVLYVLILPNVAYSFMPAVPHIGQAWSIGVEEQFYLFWPLIVKYSKNVSRVIIFLLGVYLLLKVLIILFPHLVETGNAYLAVKRFFGMSKFECMLIGAYGGVMLFNGRAWFLKMVYHPAALALSLVLSPTLSYFAGRENVLQDAVHLPLSLLFLIIILNVSSNPRSFFKMTNPLLDYLGKISYGFYMYHLIVLFLVAKLLHPYYYSNTMLVNFGIYSVSFVATCVISHFSYQFFEKFFIRKKQKYSHVLSE